MDRKFISWLYDVSAMLSDFAETVEEEGYNMDIDEMEMELTKKELAEKKKQYAMDLMKRIEKSLKDIEQVGR